MGGGVSRWCGLGVGCCFAAVCGGGEVVAFAWVGGLLRGVEDLGRWGFRRVGLRGRWVSAGAGDDAGGVWGVGEGLHCGGVLAGE